MRWCLIAIGRFKSLFFKMHTHQWGLLVFAMLILVMVGLATVCLVHGISWIDKPFAGFLFFEFAGVGSIGDYDWPGHKAGVHYRDIILDVNHEPVFSGTDIWKIIRALPPGEIVHYRFFGNGEFFELEIPITVFTLKDFIKTFGLTFIIAIVFWIIAIVVYVLKPNTVVTWVFFLFCFFLGAYIITGFEMQSVSYPPWSYYVNMVSLAFFAAALVHLSLIFPERAKLIAKYPHIPAVFYALSLPLAFWHCRAFYNIGRGQLDSDTFIRLSTNLMVPVLLNRLYIFIGATLLVGFSAFAYRRSLSVIARQRARIILLSSAVAFVPPTLLQVFIAFTKFAMPFNVSAFTMPVFPAAIGYAISRHNLFDVDVYIKRTVGYVLMTGIVTGGYFIFQTAIKTAVLDPLMGPSSEKIYPFLFALLTVFAFNPVSQRVQRWVDKLFYRREYDYKSTVADISESLTSLVDVQEFIEKVIHTVRTNLFIDRAGVVVLDERCQSSQSTFRGERFGLAMLPSELPPDLCLAPDDPLLMLLAKERKLITKYDVSEDPRYSAVKELCGQRFEELGASLALPLYYRDQFAGALALGYKKSGHFYSREDIDLLKTISTMTSTAIEQSREKGQKTVLMQLFSKHVSPQVAESLWEQREHFLEGGRPKSQSMIVTAMFTDLQGFSTLSERQTPEVLMGWLNTYLEMMTNTVMEHGGVVDDFFGDGVKINFGVPIPRETTEEICLDAVNAVTCALAMERKMIALNEKMAELGHQPLRMRIGIYTGPVVAGSLGSADRMKYTTLGDSVNTAARLESYDKDLVVPELASRRCRILIGEPTLQHLGGKFLVKKVGELDLKGKTQPIGAYCVLGAGAGPEEQEVASAATQVV